jgi:hypothetical protein
MLLGLLSGFRDARSPLVVGYVVLGALWLLLFHVIPEGHVGIHHSYPELARIFDSVGPVGIVAITSFAAYLVGDLVVRESARMLQIRGQPPIEATTGVIRQRFRKIFSFTHDAEMDELDARLKELVDRVLAEGTGSDMGPIATTPGTNLLGFRVRREAEKSPPDALPIDEQIRVEAKSGRIDERILAANPELYSELYRLRSEAEFRAGLLPSLMLLAIALAVRMPWPSWLLTILGIGFLGFEYLLLMEAFRLRTRARSIAMRAVVDELVSTPTLDAIKREPDRALASNTDIHDPSHSYKPT